MFKNCIIKKERTKTKKEVNDDIFVMPKIWSNDSATFHKNLNVEKYFVKKAKESSTNMLLK